MRQWDGTGDIGRTARQRYVLRTVIDRVLESRSFSEIITMANYAINHIETNITMDELISLALDLYLGDKPTVRELRLPDYGTFTHAIYYEAFILVFNFEENIIALHEFIYGCAEDVNIWNFTSSVMDTTVYNFLRENEVDKNETILEFLVETNEDDVFLEFLAETDEGGTILEFAAEADEAALLADEFGETEGNDKPEGNPDFEDSPHLVFETDDDPEHTSDPLSLVTGQ